MFKKTIPSFCKLLQISQTFKRNAGHSKWANIKHIKAAKDAQRSVLFTRLTRQMKVAILEGGGQTNPDMNLKLAQIIEQAKRSNMPSATIQNVLKNAQSKKEDCKSGFIEIKGTNGLLILCEVFTNNFNRCKMNISVILKKFNVALADGKSRNIFEQKGIIETKIPTIKDGNILEVATEHAIESGAEDVRQISDDIMQFICESRTLKSVQTNLEKLNYVITSASIEYIPSICVDIDEGDLEKLSVLFDKLENCEDVVKVYDNIA